MGWAGRFGFVLVMSLFYVSFYALIHCVAATAQWLEHVILTLLDCIMPWLYRNICDIYYADIAPTHPQRYLLLQTTPIPRDLIIRAIIGEMSMLIAPLAS